MRKSFITKEANWFHFNKAILSLWNCRVVNPSRGTNNLRHVRCSPSSSSSRTKYPRRHLLQTTQLPDPKQRWPLDAQAAPHIRACLSKIEFENDRIATMETGMSVCTLGTGTGASSAFRGQPATVIKQPGNAFLVDAGEGVHKQFIPSRINVRDVSKIFITHMHGDHVFGLPGLLLHLQAANALVNDQRSIDIYGPVGLFNYIVTALTLSGSEIRKLQVNVFEFHGGTQRSMRHPSHRKIFHEFRQKGIFRRAIPQNEDGTFTLMEPIEITTRELANRRHCQPEGLSIKAAEIHHVPQLQCFGYTFQEPQTQPRKLHMNKALHLGVRKIEKHRALKSGFSVASDEPPHREVHPSDVCDEPSRPRKVTILGDTCLVPPAMERLAQHSDVLVHEATLSMSDKGRKVVDGGHSTAAEAAMVANRVRAKLLLLNHLSVKVDIEDGMEEWIGEAEDRITGATRVQMAFDYMEVMIPPGGFAFSADDESSKEDAKSPEEIAASLSKMIGLHNQPLP